MKNLQSYMNEANLNWCPDIVMTFKQFMQWIQKQNKRDEFEVIVDIDQQWLKDLMRYYPNNVARVFFNPEMKTWLNEDPDSGQVQIEDWTCDYEDILYIRKA